jgi:hypothetical protein
LRSLSTVLPAPDGQLLQNTDFESSAQGWEARYGEFIHTTYESNTGMGSGKLITSSMDARGDYTGLVGQCVPLTSGAAQLEIKVHINASSGGSYINVSGVYTDDEQCRGTHVGSFSVTVEEGDGWLVIHEVVDVPDGANSLDFLISCAGASPDTSILVDDVHLSPYISP